MRSWALLGIIVAFFQPSQLPKSEVRQKPTDFLARSQQDPEERERQLCFEQIATGPCAQTYFRSPELQPIIFDLVEQKCRAGSDTACGDLAWLVQDRSEIESWSLRTGIRTPPAMGDLALVEATFGRLSKAYRFATQECRGRFQSCAFHLRYMPDHPDLDSLVVFAKLECLLNEAKSSGATSCAILGAHFTERALWPAEAEKLWSLDCRRKNPTSCFLWASLGDTAAKRAITELCSWPTVPDVSMGEDQLLRYACPELDRTGKVSVAFRQVAEDEAEGYRHQIRSVAETRWERQLTLGRSLNQISEFWVAEAAFDVRGVRNLVRVAMSPIEFDPKLQLAAGSAVGPCYETTGFYGVRGHWMWMKPTRVCAGDLESTESGTYLSWSVDDNQADDSLRHLRLALPFAPAIGLQARNVAGEPAIPDVPVRWRSSTSAEWALIQDEILAEMKTDLVFHQVPKPEHAAR